MAQVRFIKAGPVKGKDYKKGDLAAFPDPTAEALRVQGWVEIVPAKEKKGGD